MSPRIIFITIFFALQIIGIVVARIIPPRFFSWAPYDEISLYATEVTIGSKALTRFQIEERYRKPAVGRENRSINNYISIIRQYEKTYGITDSASVNVKFLTNGISKAIWLWPQDTTLYDQNE